MSVVQMTTTGLGIATAAAALFTFGASFWTARSGNQRQLRDRLRKQLREMDLLCHVRLQREGWEAIDRPPQVSVQALDQIHQDGLISPSRSHINRLKAIVRDIHGRAGIRLPREALSPEQYADMTAENGRRIQKGFDILDADTQKYLRALGKMDNHGLGGYWTYLRYRFFPAREYVN
jgi:hypothetical protein